MRRTKAWAALDSTASPGIQTISPCHSSTGQVAETGSLLPHGCAEVDVRIEVGVGDTHGRRRGVQLRLRCQDVGPPMRKLRWQADRKVLRQRELGQIELGQRGVSGRLSQDDRQRVLRETQFLAQRWQ